MDTALPQKYLFILDRNLAKANCTVDRVCTSCDIVVLGCILTPYFLRPFPLINGDQKDLFFHKDSTMHPSLTFTQ